MSNDPCAQPRGSAALKVFLWMSMVALAFAAPAAWAHQDPFFCCQDDLQAICTTNPCTENADCDPGEICIGATGTGIGPSIFAFRDAEGMQAIAADDTVLECETIYFQCTLQYQPSTVFGVVTAAFEAGDWDLQAGAADETTGLFEVPCIGGFTDDPDSASHGNRGNCSNQLTFINSELVPYTVTEADAVAGVVTARCLYGDFLASDPGTAYSHDSIEDTGGQEAQVTLNRQVVRCPEVPETDCMFAGICNPDTEECEVPLKEDSTPCTDTGLDCWDPGCEAGVCVQEHVPVAPSTPCSEVAGTECTDPGCDGQGVCDPLHIPKADSLPCTDTGLECWDAGCESGVCVQEHVPVAPSTPCSEVDGTECTDPGCDGQGTCDPLHIPKDDSLPCTDTGIDCWDAGCEGGVCVQEHVPVAPSTPCDDAQGTECTDPGCDGQGVCDPLHIPKEDSLPCTDTGIDCWDAGCEGGVCVQEHVPVAPSTPCDDAQGTECTDPGCDGQGVCDPLHIPKEDSLPCTDTGIDCWDAGCEGGVCVQEHVPVAPSTPCDDAQGTECTDPGCDGQGVCDPLHIPKEDSLPCTDTGIDCWDAGCEGGVCVQEHVPVAPSTPCDDAQGTECTDPGCDGQGVCDPLHIPKDDSLPCTDTGLECWDAGCESGVCVQAHVPVAPSTPCGEVEGTECTDPGCDGQGTCDPLHIPKDDSLPCTDTGLECWDAGCEGGICVQNHVPVAASTPCGEVEGTECTDPGCDGQGTCDALHIPKDDSTPCGDLGKDCWDPGCESGVCVQNHVPVAASTPCGEVEGTECTDPGCDGQGNCDSLHIPKDDSLPCTDTGLECWDAGCEGGICVQNHVPVAASTPCGEVEGTECTDPGCDGQGTCDALHIPKDDSTPCSDTGQDCWDAGCEGGVCVQAHVPVAASTPCDDVEGTECTDPGCDGQGTCDALHLPKADSTPCGDLGKDCWDPGCESGVCVQNHVPVAASTPCGEVEGTECTDPGCDGQGNCDSLHIPKDDSLPCTDTGQDCWDAGCEGGVCVQEHVPVAASTPCDDVEGTECTDPGCDGQGVCDSLHIPKDDSLPCTDTGQDCWDAGCEGGVCVQEHVPVAASTPCDDVDGTECTDPGCDGQGVCDSLHIPKDDSLPCTDTGQDCWDAGCEGGVCVQEHVPVAASTPCDDVDGTECTDPGCDGQGVCDAFHIPKDDSLPCTDTGQDCWDAGCEGGVCVQEHVPVAASTPCDDVDGTECTDPGCDGQGVCDSLHIPKDDSLPCTDTGQDCWDAGCEGGVCVQEHVPVAASTPCDDVDGTECTDPGCDGQGVCDSLHIPKDDSLPCTDTGQDCWDAGCEGGVCVQEHVPVAASTPCDDVDGTECTDPGCDGEGTCNALHIPKDDSLPCTDIGLECWDAGCESGVCVQTHVPVAPSTPCSEVGGTECTDPGCDGQGNCDSLHIPKDDSLPCTDTGLECWDAGCESGVCVQTHVPVAPSTPCSEVGGTECTDPGCDGQGNCDSLHIPKDDSLPCTDTGLECWDAGCESGLCVQEHVPVAPSTPCSEVDGTECTDPGCDGQGTCDALHIPKDDSTPCTDTGNLCYDPGCESGVCVQDHIPLPPCDDSNVCTDDSCDPDIGCVYDCAPADKPECFIEIGDYMWFDTDLDGIQEGAEDGIEDVKVNLVNCDTGPVAMTDTDFFGEYSFTVGVNLETCEFTDEYRIEVDDSNFDPGQPLEGLDGSPPNQGFDDAVDSDCIDGVIDCENYTTDDDTRDCGFAADTVAICRTPGFWSTHGHISSEVIKAAGGLNVCGQNITYLATPDQLGTLDNALEGLCVRPQGVKQRQLYRHLIAFYLNCVMSGETSNCDVLVPMASACDALCASGMNSDGNVSMGECSSALDCFNNGGSFDGGGGYGDVHEPLERESDRGGLIDLFADPIYEDLPDTGEPLLDEGGCTFDGDNCHERDLCPADTDGDGDPDNDGFCFEPPGPASTPKTCKNAKKNDCTIDDCD